MSSISTQYKRLLRLTAELKENKYPNAISFSKKLRNEQMNGEHSLGCSQKTIQRDVEKLKFEFNAPIKFDNSRKGYYLKHHAWNMPSHFLDEDQLLAIVFGAKVAENIFPNPLKSKIRFGVDILLAENNPEFLNTAMMESIIISPKLKSNINEKDFQTIFEGWQKHQAVEIEYKSVHKGISKRTIEPHALIFINNSWFTKAYCWTKNDYRLFALQRIISTTLTKVAYEPNKELIKQLKNDNIYGFQRIENIELICNELTMNALKETPLHNEQTISSYENEFIINIPLMSEMEIIEWVLSQRGGAIIKAPNDLKIKFLKEMKNIINKCAKKSWCK